MTSLYCNDNPVKVVGLQSLTLLERFNCENTGLDSLDVSHNKSLSFLYCGHNNLSNLDLSNNARLKHLFCACNQLTELDLSKTPSLVELDCDSNMLASLDVSMLKAVMTLYCTGNQLTALDISNCSRLTRFKAAGNLLSCINLAGQADELYECDLSRNGRKIAVEMAASGSAVSYSLPLASLPELMGEGFDLNKVPSSSWKGATLTGEVLHITADTVSYAYSTDYAGATSGLDQVRFFFTYDKSSYTGITSPESQLPVSTRYYNTMGVASDEPHDGVNIVVTTYCDGTTRTVKQLRR